MSLRFWLTWHSQSHQHLYLSDGTSPIIGGSAWTTPVKSTRFRTTRAHIANPASPHPRKSIEILPGETDAWVPESTTTYPFLFGEGNLGVPKKVLYKAYMVAIRAYFDLRNESRRSILSPSQSNLLDSLTRVILFANPAHQTALNSRKKLIQGKVVDAHWELSFSGSLLSCRECAKESILWHHRRWLLHVIYHEVPVAGGADNIPEIVPLGALEAEFACASAACHLYPRNYHAWTHQRFCVKALIASLQLEAPSTSDKLTEEYQKTLKWIEFHISDYSAMWHAISFEKILSDKEPSERRFSTKEHALSLSRSYPNHESLWMYVRSSVAPDDDIELLMTMRETPSVREFVRRHALWRKITVSSLLAVTAISHLNWQDQRGEEVSLEVLRGDRSSGQAGDRFSY